MADAVFRRRLLRLVEFAADERDHLDAVDLLDRVEMLEAERAGAGERDFDRLGHSDPIPVLQAAFSRTRWPTAVFDAGT